MDSVYFLLALAIILALFWMTKQRRIAAIRHVLNRKRNSGKDKAMEELARQFIGKECIIYTVTSTDSSIQGTVKDVTDGGHRAGKGRQRRSGQSGIRHAHP